VSRQVSGAFQAAANAEQTGEVVVILLTITHADMEETVRISNDPTQRLDLTSGSESEGSEGAGGQPVYGTISRGETYLYIPFQLTLPQEQDQSPPAARIVLENVGQELIGLLRSTSTPAQVLIEILLASDLETVEVTFPTLDLAQADYDAGQATLDLVVDYLANEPYPSGNFDPASFPGLFG